MARPTLPPGEKRTQRKIRMSDPEHDRAKRLAARWGCSLNEAINRAVVLAEASEHP